MGSSLLAPILMPLGLVAQLRSGEKTIDRTAEDVVGFIEDFLDGSGGEWDWDEFESVPISDPELDALRKRAALAAPPNPDLAELHAILMQAQEVARQRTNPTD